MVEDSKQGHRDVDVLIVGGGVGGTSAAIWSHRLGMSVWQIERERWGGQLWMIHKEIPDYPGLICQNGEELQGHLEAHMEHLGGPRRIEGEVVAIAASEGRVTYRPQGEQQTQTIHAGAIVLATGLERRRLREPDVSAWLSRGVAYTASGEKEMFVGKKVCIIGGGDGAMENALWLPEACDCPHVTVAYRGESPPAREEFLKEIREHKQIDLRLGSVLEACEGDQHLEAVILREGGERVRLEVEALLIKIGFAPVSSLLQDQCSLDPKGYVCVDQVQKTTASRCWAVGDVCTPVDPSISVSVGQGCLAAREIQRFLYG